ncbi:MAG: NIL domain-containing protein [Chloroflexi bacterium]|nr:NIL domain-containing protein [Chloroflexota bacterium]
MASARLRLVFPPSRVQEPVIGTLVRRFNVMPNIRRARISEDAGEVVLELDGAETDLERAEDYLREIGIQVEPVEGEYLEP